MNINPDEETQSTMYRLLTSIIVPRPIAWVSTVGADGTDNLAPYSFFQGVIEANPPVVMFSAEDRADGSHKDSVRNVLDTESFVLNLVTEELVEAMDRTSDPLRPGNSEFDLVGLDREPATTVPAPRVADAKVHVECSLYDTMRIGDHTVVFGRIEHVHVDDSFLTDGKIDVEKIDAVGRLTGSYYATLNPFSVD